jgi:hypothetical protein
MIGVAPAPFGALDSQGTNVPFLISLTILEQRLTREGRQYLSNVLMRPSVWVTFHGNLPITEVAPLEVWPEINGVAIDFTTPSLDCPMYRQPWVRSVERIGEIREYDDDEYCPFLTAP